MNYCNEALGDRLSGVRRLDVSAGMDLFYVINRAESLIAKGVSGVTFEFQGKPMYIDESRYRNLMDTITKIISEPMPQQ